MAFIQNEKTKKFVEQVKKLESTGVVRSFKEIADAIDYNNTALSQVLAGSRNVPNDVYLRFTEHYKESEVVKKEQVINHIDEIIALYKEQIALLKQQNEEYRHQIQIKDRRVDEIFTANAQLQTTQRSLSSEIQEVKYLVKIATSYTLACYKALEVHRVKTEKAAQEEQIASEMRNLYGEALQESLQEKR